MSQQPAYSNDSKLECGNAKRIVKEILCIPVHEKLKKAHVDHVINSIIDFSNIK